MVTGDRDFEKYWDDVKEKNGAYLGADFKHWALEGWNARSRMSAPAVSVEGLKVGKYYVTVADNAITISEGRKIVFAYDADAPAVEANKAEVEMTYAQAQDYFLKTGRWPG